MAGSSSRTRLAKHLCQQAGWLGPSGRPQILKARAALRQWETDGAVVLPPARPAPRRAACSQTLDPALALPFLDCSLEQLGPVELVLIQRSDRALSRHWNQLVGHYHYLGAGPLFGDQLRYLIRSPRGVLGALSFSAAARCLAPRDVWVGWTREACRQNRHLVVNNSRFLIRPEVKVPCLASHVLGQALRLLPEHWLERHHYQPVLVESFVEQGRFTGASYLASNWQAIGLTAGRGRQDRLHQRAAARKVIWVYPLQKDFRQILECLPERPRLPLRPARPAPEPPRPADWAEEEFGQARLGQARLNKRLCALARDLYARPGAALPQACGNRAKTKAAYRFLSHKSASMQAILEPHYQASARRAGALPVVLAVQDTTSLNYSAHPATEMLGPIGQELSGPIGLFAHSTLAFSPEGTPLGLLDVQCWARDPEQFGSRERRYQLPFEQKESVRWLRSLEATAKAQREHPQTRFVSVGDREADIYELFAWAREKPPGGPELLVRAERQRLLAGGQEKLWDCLKSLPAAGTLELQLPRRGAQAARVATLEVRFSEVQLQAPKRKPGLGPVRLWAVLARETHPPKGIKPVEWMLLTTLPAEDFESALEKLRWYARRWGIEVFHRVLKSGCAIETRQLAGADRLEACLAIDLVVAWRIYYLTRLGRETPEVPCSVYFEEHEWKALVAFVTRNPNPPQEIPTLRSAVRMVASLGGFLGRKGDGDPGTQTIWLGLQRLDDIAAMYQCMTEFLLNKKPEPSNRTYG